MAPVRLFTRSARRDRNARRAWRAVAEDRTGRGFIGLERWQFPELVMLSVSVGDSASPSLPPAGPSSGGIAVPVVPELC